MFFLYMNLTNWFYIFSIYFYLAPISGNIHQLVRNLPAEPVEIKIENSLDINNNGGHLQGIQVYNYNKEEYIYWSGSSDTYGYLAIGKSGSTNKVLKLHTLMHRPYKHAGGFQIDKNWLAIGIEDNEAKNKSKVQIYHLNNPLESLNDPVATISRSGAAMRSTAGCTAIKQLKKELLVIVGDWGTRHLDFYKAALNDQEKINFDKVFEINTDHLNKNHWVNTSWWAYQNINLIEIQDNLYLFGFATNHLKEDLIDVFRLHVYPDNKYSLTKIDTRTFKGSDNTQFRWGAGLSFNNEDQLTIYSCSRTINEKTFVSVFRSN